jgi:hypothetical protein
LEKKRIGKLNAVRFAIQDGNGSRSLHEQAM